MKEKHTHKYERVIMGRKRDWPVYKCVLPDCPHFLQPELVVGRASICHSCEGKFLITKQDARMKKPICSECREERKRTLERLKNVPNYVPEADDEEILAGS